MAATLTYGGVTFNVVLDGGMQPMWEQDDGIVERVIPGANKSDVQSSGRSNHRVTIQIRIANDTDMATLQALAGATARALTSTGLSWAYSNVVLRAPKNVRRLGNSAQWFATVTLIRQGS